MATSRTTGQPVATGRTEGRRTDGRPTGRKLRRGVQQERAVAAALRLAQRDGVAGLTMRRLGEEIQLDPASLYRVFRDKDELLLAIYDRVIAETLAGVEPRGVDEPWTQLLRRVADAIYRTTQRHPAVTALTFARTTGGPAERQMVELILGAFTRAGLPSGAAVLYYRAFVDAALGLCGQNAAILTLDPQVRAKDAAAWTRIYAQLPAEEYPAARAHITELIEVPDRAVYDAVIEAILAAAQHAAGSLAGAQTHAAAEVSAR